MYVKAIFNSMSALVSFPFRKISNKHALENIIISIIYFYIILSLPVGIFILFRNLGLKIENLRRGIKVGLLEGNKKNSPGRY